ncbi:MAG: hypothetical protein IRZ03_11855 [Acidobacterium ailaaui]|nr:hypothetical protein [Pseudacidobacterium ailaaui]
MAEARGAVQRQSRTDDLVRRLCHALDIAKLTVEHLVPDGYIDSTDSTKNVRPEKILSETAVLLLAAGQVVQPEIQERVKGIAHGLAPHARNERARLGVCVEPSAAWEYALGHLCLNRLGYPDVAFDALLQHALGSRASAGRERVPHRMLEKEWSALGVPGLASNKRRSEMAHLSILNHSMDLLSCRREDMYAFTHALMYVTDFGIHPVPLPRPRHVLLAEAEALLAYCLDQQDYDVAGEILLSWPLTGEPWSPAATFAFRVLAHVEDKTGFLPTPGTRICEIEARSGTERTRYRLATAYHTAYVMGLLCAAVLSQGHMPPAEVSEGDAKAGGSDHLLRFLEADEEYRPHWRDTFDPLTSQQKDALSGFLLHIALRRKAMQRDYGGLLQVLQMACNLDLADGPCAVQAVELLDRLARYSECVHPA